MKFSKSHKLHKCLSKDECREALQYVNFDGERLTATNGHIAVFIKVEDTKQDKPCLIPAEALQKAVKGSAMNQAVISTNGDIKVDNTPFEKPEDINYPDTDQLRYDAIKAKKDKVFTLGLNAKLLKNLSEAMGSNILYLHFQAEGFSEDKDFTKPIAVSTEYYDENIIGIIMPVKGH